VLLQDLTLINILCNVPVVQLRSGVILLMGDPETDALPGIAGSIFGGFIALRRFAL
jgi:hypothetical protein